MILDTIKEHPMPAMLTGIGMTWLCMSARSANGRGHSPFSTRPHGQYVEYDDTPMPGEPSAGHAAGGAPEQIQAAMSEAKHKAEAAASEAKHKAEQIAGQVKEQVSTLGEQAHDRAQRVAAGYDQMLHNNPLAIGAIALTLGLAIGLLIPETRPENRLMGEAKERLVESAQETAQEVAQKVQSVAKEACDAAAEEAERQGLTA